jgi:hypothetical protein
LLGAALVLLAGCQEQKPKDATVVLSTRPANPKVENGWAYDKATLDCGRYKVVVVPHDAQVERGGSDKQVEIYMEKEQSFSGHPPELASIRDARKEMGCARKEDKDKVVLATYGEFDSNIEGGTFMKLRLRIPAGLTVETRTGLSGPIRARLRPGERQRREDIRPGFGGWEAIPDEPDPQQTARSAEGR